MSGHSKWHSIRHKKAAVDAKRGKIFSKLVKEITIAAQLGGGELMNNPRLRTAVQAARDASMPAKNIENAIKKGTGELDGGSSFEELTFEGYGPGGAAFIVTCTTDNRNRTAAEIRHVFSKLGGNLGESGCVSWMFERKGQIRVEAPAEKEDLIMEAGLEAGATDISYEGDDSFLVVTEPNDEILEAVRNALVARGLTVSSSEILLVPNNTVTLSPEHARKCLKMTEAFEDHDDVQTVSSNFELSDELLEEMAG